MADTITLTKQEVLDTLRSEQALEIFDLFWGISTNDEGLIESRIAAQFDITEKEILQELCDAHFLIAWLIADKFLEAN